MKKLTILFLMAISLQASAQVTTPLASRRGVGGEAAGYLFAYFEGGGDQNLMEQLRFAVSEDAQNWYARNSIFSTVHPQKRSSQPSGKFSLQHRFEAF